MEDKQNDEIKQEEQKKEYKKLEGKELIKATLKKALFLTKSVETLMFSYKTNRGINKMIGMIDASLKELEKLK